MPRKRGGDEVEEPCGREKDLELETAVESIVEDGEKHQKYHFVLFNCSMLDFIEVEG